MLDEKPCKSYLPYQLANYDQYLTSGLQKKENAKFDAEPLKSSNFSETLQLSHSFYEEPTETYSGKQ